MRGRISVAISAGALAGLVGLVCFGILRYGAWPDTAIFQLQLIVLANPVISALFCASGLLLLLPGLGALRNR